MRFAVACLALLQSAAPIPPCDVHYLLKSERGARYYVEFDAPANSKRCVVEFAK